MIIEAICYGYEADLLHGRLATLADHVDLIVIVESDKTHTGKPKGYTFDPNRYTEWMHKINYRQLVGLTTPDAWTNEAFHRASMRDMVAEHASADDLVIVCDVDEWWQPEHLNEFGPDVCVMNMRKHHFKADWFDKMEYAGWATTWQNAQHLDWYHHKISICNARPAGTPPGRVIETGWHFSSLGTWDQVAAKIGSFSHTEFDNDNTRAAIRACYDNGHDLTGHRFTPIDRATLPAWFITDAPKDWFITGDTP